MKKARISILTKLSGDVEEYNCRYAWPDDCFVQAGDRGLVVTKRSKQGHYKTAFFEAFPRKPDTFIRGEGKTIEAAEAAAWSKYQKHLTCPGHEFERRGYKNGAGFCKHCNLFASKVFEPDEECCICGKKTYWSADREEKNWYCEEHYEQNPDKLDWL